MVAPILCGQNAFAVVPVIRRQRRKQGILIVVFALGEDLNSQNSSII